jgi:hypothetical protein
MLTRSRNSDWPADRLAEARAVIADVAHHSDQLIRLACNVLVAHGETATEREDARVLLVVIDARRPLRQTRRGDDDAEAVR